MIFTKVAGFAEEMDVSDYHIETVIVSNDDLNKRILRFKTDHGNEYGVRLNEESEALRNGALFFIDDHNAVLITVRSEEFIEIQPKSMDEMGEVAHMLGNTHKPIVVENERIYLEIDPVVIQLLEKKKIAHEIKKITLKKPLKHVDLNHAH